VFIMRAAARRWSSFAVSVAWSVLVCVFMVWAPVGARWLGGRVGLGFGFVQ